MNNKLLIRKASGDMEPFSSEKLRRSLQRSGAADNVIEPILNDVESWIYDGISSRKIYDRAFALLRKKTLSVASRYKLKNALMEMGPTGHPFEHFAGQVFKALGYNVEVAQILQGHCVTHEVDVIASKEKSQMFIECKYYLTTDKNANVQVPLYIRSRVDDIIKKRSSIPEFAGYTFSGGVVTNTRFTSDAMAYGECSGLKLLSWDYPVGNGLKDIIDREKIFPITVLTKLSNQDKQRLMGQGIVTCLQILETPGTLDSLGIEMINREKILAEIKNLCVTD
ncbi:MAG: restriction endonuclease [Bacteroidales bacterium]|nr:restriction endonuclease [Bacteroidales bacterium]